MSGFRAYSLLLAVALSVLPACEKQGGNGEGKGVPVQLAISVGSNVTGTKGNPAVITEMSASVTFRGMTGIILLPFDIRGTIEADDHSVYFPSRMSDISQRFYPRAVAGSGDYVDGLVENNRAHVYPTGEVMFPGGTASVLAYGQAPLVAAENDIRSQHLNGALEVAGLGGISELRYASDIHFDPVRILPQIQALPADAQTLANYLNALFVPEVKYETTLWYEDNTWHEAPISLVWDGTIDDPTLRECYLETVNGGNLMPGSGRSVEYMLSRIYRRLKSRLGQNNAQVEYTHGGIVYPAMKENGGSVPLTWEDLYRGLQDVITARIEAMADALAISGTNEVTFRNSTLRDYPEALGLPEGAALLRWNGSHFYPVADLTGDSEEGVAPLSSYCYPPRLWYFANSTLSTSSADNKEVYTNEKESWTDILGEYRFGKVVNGTTRGVALDQPLQFSCGLLIATVAAASADLDDGDGDSSTTVHVDDDTFPVTGVVIGSQQRLNFDFTPAGGRSLSLYDNCISGVYAKAVPQSSADSFRTFVSQTPDGEDVYLCLELRNDSGQPFTGADGVVLPGSKFYLVGNIELGPGETSVFQQDHATTIHCRIASLAQARNAIPNLEQPHLALGILISSTWTQSTPGHVILS